MLSDFMTDSSDAQEYMQAVASAPHTWDVPDSCSMSKCRSMHALFLLLAIQCVMTCGVVHCTDITSNLSNLCMRAFIKVTQVKLCSSSCQTPEISCMDYQLPLLSDLPA